MAAPHDPPHWTLLVPWGFSLASLAFSFFNLWFTQRTASRLRVDTNRREEFNTAIRRPIEGALADIHDELLKLRPLLRSYKGLSLQKDEAAQQVGSIVDRSQKLLDLLVEADRLAWISASDWSETASPLWDTFLDRANDVQEAADKATFNAALNAACEALSALARTVRLKITSEIEIYMGLPKRKPWWQRITPPPAGGIGQRRGGRSPERGA